MLHLLHTQHLALVRFQTLLLPAAQVFIQVCKQVQTSLYLFGQTGAHSICHIEGFQPEWCISAIYHVWDKPFWSGTLDIYIYTHSQTHIHGLTQIKHKYSCLLFFQMAHLPLSLSLSLSHCLEVVTILTDHE